MTSPLYTAKHHTIAQTSNVYVWDIDGERRMSWVSDTFYGERRWVPSGRLSSFTPYPS